ncbi:MAG: ABC transporter ATP-binding protein [Anaerolineae bacterium]
MRLELRDVRKEFREDGRLTLAVDHLSFTVEAGEFVTLLGPSGSGKSTAFNLITGLITPDSGDILLDGQRINGRTGLVGYMPQRDLLLAWRTLIGNVIIGAEIEHQPRDQAIRRARELLPLFGLEGFETAYPAQLSGGMRQRAALLRTFLLQKEVMLLDEPFGALDALTRADLQNWLLGVWLQFKPTVLFITHDVREAALLSDRVLIFTSRPGRVKEEIRIDLPRPRDDTSPDFVQMQTRLLRALQAEPTP